MITLEAALFGVSLFIYVAGAGGVGLSIHGPSHVMSGEAVLLDCMVPTETLADALSLDWRYRPVGDRDALFKQIYQYRLYPEPAVRSYPAGAYLNQSSAVPATAVSIPLATVERNGEYRCEVETDDGVLATNHTLAVIQLPVTNLSTSLAADAVLSVGDRVAVNCSVRAGHPRPDVYWVLDDDRIDIDNTQIMEEDGGDSAGGVDGQGGRWKLVKSTLTVKERHLGKRLGCRAKVTSNQGREYVVKSHLVYLNSGEELAQEERTEGDVEDVDGKPDNSGYSSSKTAAHTLVVSVTALLLTLLLATSS